jgi:hypothetical protein
MGREKTIPALQVENNNLLSIEIKFFEIDRLKKGGKNREQSGAKNQFCFFQSTE